MIDAGHQPTEIAKAEWFPAHWVHLGKAEDVNARYYMWTKNVGGEIYSLQINESPEAIREASQADLIAEYEETTKSTCDTLDRLTSERKGLLLQRDKLNMEIEVYKQALSSEDEELLVRCINEQSKRFILPEIERLNAENTSLRSQRREILECLYGAKLQSNPNLILSMIDKALDIANTDN